MTVATHVQPVTKDVVDAQLHVWTSDSGSYPWDPRFGSANETAAKVVRHAREVEVTAESVLRSMDAADVRGALLVTPGIYGYDNSYALAAAARHPDRFRVVGRLDHRADDIADLVRDWKATPGSVGIRIVVLTEEQVADWRGGRFGQLLGAAQRDAVPVCIYAPGLLADVVTVAAGHPDLTLVVDHLGIPQPPAPVERSDPFGDIPRLLELAAMPNIYVKVTGLSFFVEEGFPESLVESVVLQLLEVFGPDRLMAGTDWTRPSHGHDYARAWAPVRGIRALKAAPDAILAGTLRSVFDWPDPRNSDLDIESNPVAGSASLEPVRAIETDVGRCND